MELDGRETFGNAGRAGGARLLLGGRRRRRRAVGGQQQKERPQADAQRPGRRSAGRAARRQNRRGLPPRCT